MDRARRRRRSSLIAPALALLWGTSASATVMVQLGVEALAERADAVVVARVGSSRVEPDGSGQQITRIRIDVEHTLAGDHGLETTLNLIQPHGAPGGRSSDLAGMPELVEKSRIVLFLERRHRASTGAIDEGWLVVGGFQGVFHLTEEDGVVMVTRPRRVPGVMFLGDGTSSDAGIGDHGRLSLSLEDLLSRIGGSKDGEVDIEGATGSGTILLFEGDEDDSPMPMRWREEDWPVRYWVADYNLPDLDPTRRQDAIAEAMDVWNAVQASSFAFQLGGLISENTPSLYDLHNRITFDDPGNVIASGIVALTYRYVDGTHEHEGLAHRTLVDADIVFNDDVSLIYEADIAGECSDAHSFEAVLVQALGHALGLDHPDSGMTADGSIMEPDLQACEEGKAVLDLADVQAISALYPSGEPIEWPAFSAWPTLGYAPLEVAFTDASLGATAWHYDFGDGRSSNDANPVHIYETPGTFHASLRINGTETADTVEIVVHPMPHLDFAASPTSAAPGETIRFSNLSEGPGLSDFEWTFGDGTTSQEHAPSHAYAQPGSYTVTLSAEGPGGRVSREKPDLIVVEVSAESDAPDTTDTDVPAESGGCSISGGGSTWSWVLLLALFPSRGLLRTKGCRLGPYRQSAQTCRIPTEMPAAAGATRPRAGRSPAWT